MVGDRVGESEGDNDGLVVGFLTFVLASSPVVTLKSRAFGSVEHCSRMQVVKYFLFRGPASVFFIPFSQMPCEYLSRFCSSSCSFKKSF